MPLVDCALLVAACEKGFAEEEGIALSLHRETSWATLWDRVAFRHLDAAQMLGPIPIASTLGLGHLPVEMIAPMALGLGGNAFTVSLALWRELEAHGASPANDPANLGAAMKELVEKRRQHGAPPLTLAVVHPFSGHNYELRYWLAAAGLHPDHDLRIVVVPPFLTAEALAAGEVDGFCAGEPWGTVAVQRGVGRMALTKSAIWRQSPEKVLGLRADWYEANPERTRALVRALTRAALWCGNPDHAGELAEMLARPDYLDMPVGHILPALTCRMVPEKGEEARIIPDFLTFSEYAATFPWMSHGLWFYSQMVRWGHAHWSDESNAILRRCYRPDIYREALKGLEGVHLPTASSKVEGALVAPTHVGSVPDGLILGPDGFFDAKRFDPDELKAYVESFPVRSC